MTDMSSSGPKENCNKLITAAAGRTNYKPHNVTMQVGVVLSFPVYLVQRLELHLNCPAQTVCFIQHVLDLRQQLHPEL